MLRLNFFGGLSSCLCGLFSLYIYYFVCPTLSTNDPLIGINSHFVFFFYLCLVFLRDSVSCLLCHLDSCLLALFFWLFWLPVMLVLFPVFFCCLPQGQIFHEKDLSHAEQMCIGFSSIHIPFPPVLSVARLYLLSRFCYPFSVFCFPCWSVSFFSKSFFFLFFLLFLYEFTAMGNQGKT